MRANKSRLSLGALICVYAGNAPAALPVPSLPPGAQILLGQSPLTQSDATLGAVLLVALAGLLVWRKLAHPAANVPAGGPGQMDFPAVDRREKLAEEEDFDRFVAEFRAGPAAGVPDGRTGGHNKGGAANGIEPDVEFFGWAAEQVGGFQRLIEKSRQTENPATRRDLLVEICGQIVTLKHRAGRPDLRPAWQLAGALEGLLKQLVGRMGNVNDSTLRTLAGGLELLGDLCKPGVRADLATSPPAKILAGDDDPVSRYALSAAVKKAFDQPDLAENGQTVLAQVRQQRYDLIMLDVMMPDMDGFEVCGKIRESTPNSSTPVLFVTALKDFDSRTRSLSTGGSDLMGKPFITFEVAVKTLTLILRARLRARDPMCDPSARVAVVGAPAIRWPESRPASEREEQAGQPVDLPVDLKGPADQPGADRVALLPPAPFEVAAVADGNLRAAPRDGAPRFSPAFLSYMEVFLREMKRQTSLIGGMNESEARQEMLVRLHLRLQSLSRKIDLPELQPAYEVCCVVEGLCKKLKNDARKVTPSALRTAANGLELLKDLCAPGVKPDLAASPPIRILVVDDEPLARRALVGALQMGFARPDSADSAASALAAAGEKEFDLVFLDVCMPEMDGFTVCAKIHETAANPVTPVVFVTNHSDEEFRAEARRHGALDYVVKPFDFLEIPVKALTYALRGRLEKSKASQPPGATVPA